MHILPDGTSTSELSQLPANRSRKQKTTPCCCNQSRHHYSRALQQLVPTRYGGPLPTTLQGLTASASGPALSNSLNTMRHAAAGPHLLPQQLHCSSSAARAAPHSHSLAMHENSCTLASCCGVRLTSPAALGPIFASGQNPSSLVCMCMHHESTALLLGPTWCGIQLAPACCPRA